MNINKNPAYIGVQNYVLICLSCLVGTGAGVWRGFGLRMSNSAVKDMWANTATITSTVRHSPQLKIIARRYSASLRRHRFWRCFERIYIFALGEVLSVGFERICSIGFEGICSIGVERICSIGFERIFSIGVEIICSICLREFESVLFVLRESVLLVLR